MKINILSLSIIILDTIFGRDLAVKAGARQKLRRQKSKNGFISARITGKTVLTAHHRDHCSDEGLLPWTIRCFFCDDTISYSSCIDHFKNDCQDLNWIQQHKGTEELLNSSIIEDGDITVKLNGVDNACIILQDAIVMLKRTDGRDEWKVAVVGSDAVQLKYSEEMT